MVIGLEGVLGNALLGNGSVGRQPETLLQLRQRQPMPRSGLLQPGEHRLVGRQAAADMEGLHHESGCVVTVAAGAQLLPEVPPALIREQLPLVAAVQQRPRLAAQGIDQMVQLDRPGPAMSLHTAVQAHQLAGDRAAQQHLQPVVEDPHRHLVADQTRRHGVDNPPHLDRAGAPHRELLDVVVGKAMRRQGPQRRLLLLQAAQPGTVVLRRHLHDEGFVGGHRLEIMAATQQQRLLDPFLEVAVGALHPAVLMGDTAVVAAVGQADVMAEGVVAAGDVGGKAAVAVAAGG